MRPQPDTRGTTGLCPVIRLKFARIFLAGPEHFETHAPKLLFQLFFYSRNDALANQQGWKVFMKCLIRGMWLWDGSSKEFCRIVKRVPPSFEVNVSDNAVLPAPSGSEEQENGGKKRLARTFSREILSASRSCRQPLPRENRSPIRRYGPNHSGSSPGHRKGPRIFRNYGIYLRCLQASAIGSHKGEPLGRISLSNSMPLRKGKILNGHTI